MSQLSRPHSGHVLTQFLSLKKHFQQCDEATGKWRKYPGKVFNVYALCLKADHVLLNKTNSYVCLIKTQIWPVAVDMFVIIIISRNKSQKIIKISFISLNDLRNWIWKLLKFAHFAQLSLRRSQAAKKAVRLVVNTRYVNKILLYLLLSSIC